jgi:hypothetical protein
MHLENQNEIQFETGGVEEKHILHPSAVICLTPLSIHRVRLLPHGETSMICTILFFFCKRNVDLLMVSFFFQTQRGSSHGTGTQI